jgi:hypothetical protein
VDLRMIVSALCFELAAKGWGGQGASQVCFSGP